MTVSEKVQLEAEGGLNGGVLMVVSDLVRLRNQGILTVISPSRPTSSFLLFPSGRHSTRAE